MANKRVKSVEPTAWIGWIFFAATMLLVIGGMQIIAGLVGIMNNQFYAAVTSGAIIAFNYTAWGWINLLLGVVAMLSGLGILAGSAWARVVGVFLTVLVMIANVAFLSAYPLWSIISLVVGGCVIYALTMHGDELSE